MPFILDLIWFMTKRIRARFRLLVKQAIGYSNVITIGLCFLAAAAAFWYYQKERLFYIGSDIYYYLSLADSFLKNRLLLDITKIPAQPVKTPQNGIVLWFILLKTWGVGDYQIIRLTSIINFCLYIIAFYFVYRLGKRMKFKPWQQQLLALFYFTHWGMYRYQMTPYNDGVFYFIGLALVYFIVEQLFFDKKRWGYICLLSMVIGHFRVQGYLVLFSAVIVSLLLKKTGDSVKYLGLVGLSMALLIMAYQVPLLPLGQIKQANLSSQSDSLLSIYHTYIDGRLEVVNKVNSFVNEELPLLLLSPLGSISLYLNYLYIGLVSLPLTWVVIKIRRGEVNILTYLMTISLSTYGFALVSGYNSARFHLYLYIMTVISLIYIARFIKMLGLILIVYIMLLVVYLAFNLTRPFHRECRSQLVLSLADKGISLGKDSILLSEDARHTYYFLGYPATKTIKEMGNQQLYVFGSNKYIQTTVDKIEQQTDRKSRVTPIVELTVNQEGCGLVQLK